MKEDDKNSYLKGIDDRSLEGRIKLGIRDSSTLVDNSDAMFAAILGPKIALVWCLQRGTYLART
jgi:hypothetical protein